MVGADFFGVGDVVGKSVGSSDGFLEGRTVGLSVGYDVDGKFVVSGSHKSGSPPKDDGVTIGAGTGA